MNKLFIFLLLSTSLLGCTDADLASRNLSKAADMFELNRRIVFYNGITGDYVLSITGNCSVTTSSNQLEVTCKTGPDKFKKHYLGLSDNVTYFSQQVDEANVGTDRYRVIFKPSVIVPDAEAH